MKLITKYFYENGQEVKRGELVYLQGGEVSYGFELSGLFKIASVNEDILTVHFLGQDREISQLIEIDVDSISVLMPVTNHRLIEEVEEVKREIFNKVKNRE